MNLFNDEQHVLCMYVWSHKTQKVDCKSQNSIFFIIDFEFTKENQKLYKGKYTIGALPSFLKSNQFSSLTRLLNLHNYLDRHPYWPYPKPYGYMAIFPKYSNILINFSDTFVIAETDFECEYISLHHVWHIILRCKVSS